jgi:type I restriction enzyme R subunit
LADGEERSIQHIVATVFYKPDGSTMSATECVEKLYGELPKLFRNEDQLRALWSAPNTRKNLLEGLREAGYENNYMDEITRLVDAVDSD